MWGAKARLPHPAVTSASAATIASRAQHPALTSVARLGWIRPGIGRGFSGGFGRLVAVPVLLLRSAVAVAAGVVGAGRKLGVGDAMLAALVVPEPHRFLVDLGAGDSEHALSRLELGARRRQRLVVLAVRGQLVGEAAQQPSAG